MLLAENPPLDGHMKSDPKPIPSEIKPGHSKFAIGVWKGVDERRW